MAAESATLHYAACHMLLDIAAKPHEHAHVTDSKLEQLCRLLRSDELRVQVCTPSALVSIPSRFLQPRAVVGLA